MTPSSPDLSERPAGHVVTSAARPSTAARSAIFPTRLSKLLLLVLPTLASATQPISGPVAGPLRLTAFDAVIACVFATVVLGAAISAPLRAQTVRFLPAGALLGGFLVFVLAIGGLSSETTGYVGGPIVGFATVVVVKQITPSLSSYAIVGWGIGAGIQMMAALQQGFDRATGLARFPNELGLFGVVALGVIILGASKRYRGLSGISGLAVVLALMCVVLSAGRAAFGGALVLGVLGLVRLGLLRLRLAVLISAVVIAGVAVGVSILPRSASFATERLAGISSSSIASDDFYYENWRAGLNKISEEPVTGNGLPGALVKSGLLAGDFEIHNSLIAIGAIGGMLGVILFALFLRTLLRALVDANATRLVPVAPMLVALSVVGMYQYLWNSRAAWLGVATALCLTPRQHS